MNGTTVEPLEGRLLFADGTPPTLESVRLLGTPGQAMAIALSFSEPLDPARAVDFHWGDGSQVWVEGATPDGILTGTVRPRHGTGAATTSLLEIINPGAARLDVLNNPSFHVGG